MRSKYILPLLAVFMVSLSSAMLSFDHGSVFTNEKMSQTYQSIFSLPDSSVVAMFKECSANGGSIDPKIETELNHIVSNRAGRETLCFIVARLHPFLECANTLERLLDVIPSDEQMNPSDVVNKAKAVTLLCDALGVIGGDVFDTLLNISNLLGVLKLNPVVFPAPNTAYKSGSLLKVFKDDIRTEKREKQNYIINEINQWWDISTHNAVAGILAILREGMFSLRLGARTEYRYNLSSHTADIFLSSVNPSISARCITGPLLYDQIDTIQVPVCYQMQDKKIKAASGLHHEIFHHLVIGLELGGFPSFSLLAEYLKNKQIDRLYILNLKNIYTDMDEFRNIIGIFVNDKGVPYFDPCSEASYLCSDGKYIRGTHKSMMRGMLYIPISFVELIETSIGSNFKIKKMLSFHDCSRVVWN